MAKGQETGGRTRGTPNRYTATHKEMVLQGAVQWRRHSVSRATGRGIRWHSWRCSLESCRAGQRWRAWADRPAACHPHSQPKV